MWGFFYWRYMMEEGWIKLHRKILKWEWYKTANMYHLFGHLLLNANHHDGKWQGIEVKRGQLITGLKSLNEDTGISIQSLRTCIGRLKSTGEITIQSTNRFSIITVCNYEDYQLNENDINNPINNQVNKQLTNNQQTTNNKQEELRIIKNKKKEEGEILNFDLKKKTEEQEHEEWEIENARKNREFFKLGEYAEPEEEDSIPKEFQ